MTDKPTSNDAIYAVPRVAKAFEFNSEVASVFSDMISRSVPGYGMTLDMIGVIAEQYGKAGTQAYDLGCSLGAATLAMRHNLPLGIEKIIAVDLAKPMLENCAEVLAHDEGAIEVDLQEADICQVPINNASMVVMNFTLQFIALEKRQQLLNDIAAGMNAGGALVLSEKVHFSEPEHNLRLSDLHHGFKKSQGYSELEIAQKRDAIENVLIPESIADHQLRLQKAGFAKVYVWFQCFNFVSLLAVK